MHGRQVQLWSQALGRSLVVKRDREVLAYQERGVRPQPPLNGLALLVIGLDGGRVQSKEKKGDGQPLGGRQGLHAHVAVSHAVDWAYWHNYWALSLRTVASDLLAPVGLACG